MNDIKPNVTGYLELLLRLTVATFLVPIILYTEWMVLIPLPFYILVTVMSGYDPMAAFLAKRFRWKTRPTPQTRSRKITRAEATANSPNTSMHYEPK